MNVKLQLAGIHSRYLFFSVSQFPMLSRKALVSMAISCVHTRSFSCVSEWSGLEAWRSAPIDDRRVWGQDSPIPERNAPWNGTRAFLSEDERLKTEGRDNPCADLASWGALVLTTTDPFEKASLTHRAFRLWKSGELPIGVAIAPETPGRPPKPVLVPPRQVPSPKESSLTPSAHMLHNLAHIELNAIDLAWDTVVRFSSASSDLGPQFFADFLHVADDESRHFRWCSQRLLELGFRCILFCTTQYTCPYVVSFIFYGDMPAHNLLWKDCLRTSANVTSRLAVIPMMQEARGLDAGPRLVKRLLGLGDLRSAGIVRRIGEEEVAHVAVGVAWFLSVCDDLGINSGVKFKELMEECGIELHGPFNYTARSQAGLPRDWYDKSSREEEKSMTQAEVAFSSSTAIGNDSNSLQATAIEHDSNKLLEDGQIMSFNVSTVLDSVELASHGQLCERERRDIKSHLPEVYERLALLVAMESENAGV